MVEESGESLIILYEKTHLNTVLSVLPFHALSCDWRPPGHLPRFTLYREQISGFLPESRGTVCSAT